MHWVEFDDVRLPKRIGGHVALDFCNTWAGWGEPPDPRREWIPDYTRLVAWARFAELLILGAPAGTVSAVESVAGRCLKTARCPVTVVPSKRQRRGSAPEAPRRTEMPRLVAQA